MAGPYVHIMLTGENPDHIMTAIKDIPFRRIQTVYLIHSPDEPKSRDGKKKAVKFKVIAETLKDDILKHDSNIKVKLKQIKNPFDVTDTENAISDIIAAEQKLIEQSSIKNIVINITGGTNMMAAAAMVSAGSHQTSAYYVLNKNFQKNLDSWVKPIEIPNFRRQHYDDEDDKLLLNEIALNDFIWKYDIMMEKNAGEGRVTLDESIQDTIWLSPQKIEGAITESDLVVLMQENHEWSMNKTRTRLKNLASLADISRNHDVPKCVIKKTGKITSEKYEYTYKTFKIDEKEFLIKIQDIGRSKIRSY